MTKFSNISEVSKILGLTDPMTNKPLNHILRYWEKEFKQVKPKKINNRRYYSMEDIRILKTIKFLLKDSKMTISGAKNLLNSNVKKLDDSTDDSLKNIHNIMLIRKKSKKIQKKILELKLNGKKISS